MKKRNIIIIIILVILVIIAIVFFTRKNSSKNVYRLETTKISINDINVMVTATGTVEPITKVEVGTQVSGKIDKLYVDYNSEVTKGQILAELDKVTLQSDLQSKEMEVQSSRAEYNYQKANYNRIKDLFEKELISKTDYETALYNFQRAEASYNKLQSDLNKVRTNLGYATIYSPIDGVILSRAVEEGQTVAASFNTPTLFTIANDLTKMQVVANIDEADIGEVEEGQRVTFTVDAFPADVFEGFITQVRLEPTTTSNVVTYEVIVNAPNPELKLKPGLTANITIYTMEEKGVPTLPNKALSFAPNEEILQSIGYTLVYSKPDNVRLRQNQQVIWTVSNNTLQPRVVEKGKTDGINTEIKSELGKDEIIAVGVVLNLKNALDNNSEKAQSPFMPKRPGGRR